MDKTAIINSLISLRNNFEFGWFGTAERKNTSLEHFQFAIERANKKLEVLNGKEILTDEEKEDKALFESDTERYSKYIENTLDYNYKQEFENLIHDFENNNIGIETLTERVNAIKARGQGIEKIDEIIELRFAGLDLALGIKPVDLDAQKKGQEVVDEVVAEVPEESKQKAKFEQPTQQLQERAFVKSGLWGKFIRKCLMAMLAIALLPTPWALASMAAVLVKDAIVEMPAPINSLSGNMIIDSNNLEESPEVIAEVQEELDKAKKDIVPPKSSDEHSLEDESEAINPETNGGNQDGATGEDDSNDNSEEILEEQDVLDGLSKEELLSIKSDLGINEDIESDMELESVGQVR